MEKIQEVQLYDPNAERYLAGPFVALPWRAAARSWAQSLTSCLETGIKTLAIRHTTLRTHQSIFSVFHPKTRWFRNKGAEKPTRFLKAAVHLGTNLWAVPGCPPCWACYETLLAKSKLSCVKG